MKITNEQLRQIKSRAIANFRELDSSKLDADTFISKCWVESVAAVLNITPEYEERQLEAAEE